MLEHQHVVKDLMKNTAEMCSQCCLCKGMRMGDFAIVLFSFILLDLTVCDN